MLNCDKVTQLCSDELERPLSLWERASLKMHIMMCKGCANYRRQTSEIRRAMHRYSEGRAISTESENGHSLK
jgi:predicted anti-sigma-YlaC factor YlaD